MTKGCTLPDCRCIHCVGERITAAATVTFPNGSESHQEIEVVTALDELRKLQDAADFLARSWWRRTIINLVGGGDRGIRIEKAGKVTELARKR